MLLIDLDGFEPVNDVYGHLAGDRLLRDIAHALRDRLHAGDTIARLGGNEFAIIAPFAVGASARSLARDLLAVVRAPSRADIAGDAGLTARIGIARVAGATLDAVRLVAAADDAMYAAKRAGGDTTRFAARAEHDEVPIDGRRRYPSRHVRRASSRPAGPAADRVCCAPRCRRRRRDLAADAARRRRVRPPLPSTDGPDPARRG